MKQLTAAFFGCLLLTACAGGAAKKSGANGTADESPADLYVNMAAAYYQRGQMDAALERALQGLAEDRRNPRVHYVLGIIYQRLGKTDEARQRFAEAVRIEPKNPDFLNAHGSMLCLERKYSEAIAQFELALQDPLYQYLRQKLAPKIRWATARGDRLSSY
jgi:type IV pilus assembly protein PilF